MQVNKYKNKTLQDNVEMSSAPNSIDIVTGNIPGDTTNKLYNFNGDLYWGNINISSAVVDGSKWSISNNQIDIFRNSGKVGINTISPITDLDVNGKIKAKDLQIGNKTGFVKSLNGDIKVSELFFSELSDVSFIGNPQNCQLLVFSDAKWTNKFISEISHSSFSNLESDDHIQYLNIQRHNEIQHKISSLDVNSIFVVNSTGVYIYAPLVIGNTITLNDKLIVNDLELPGLSGILVAKNGKITAGITTTDVPEGVNKYFSEEKVVNIVQGNYLALDGSNIGRFSGFKKFVEGLDSDKLDGKDASDFSLISHNHGHNILDGVGPNDHHDQKHNIISSDHIVKADVGKILKIVDIGTLDFVNISIDDLPYIPFSKINNGEINGDDISKLKNIRSNVQEQIDNKTNLGHTHNHKDFTDLNEDNYIQYLNYERALEWIKTIDTDSITEGKNLYYSDDKVKLFSDSRYITLDGSNINNLDFKNITVNINADMVDGHHASDLSKIGHSHSHNELYDIGPNEHHPQIHNMIGDDHIIDEKEGLFLKTSHDNKLTYGNILSDDIPNNIPASKISDGKISNYEWAFLFGIKSNIQEQLDSKSPRVHTHSYNDIIDRDKDNYQIYYNKERLENWLSSKTLDDISDGTKNKHSTIDVLKELIELDNSLYWDNNKISLKYNQNIFDIIDGKLSTIQNISKDGHVSFASVNVGNVLIKNGNIGINILNPKTALDVVGGANFDSVKIKGKNGIAIFKEGNLTGNATLSDLSDVNISSTFDNCMLIYRNNNWTTVDPKQIIPIPDFTENFNVESHSLDSHNINKININNGTFSTDKNNIKFGDETKNVNIYLDGELEAKGNLKIYGSLLIGTSFARDIIDLGINSIVAGPNIDIYNRFSLFNENDNSATIELYDGVKFRFNSNDASDVKVASFDIVHDGIIQFNALTNKELTFSVGDEASINFSTGGLKVFTINSKDYIGLGTANPILPVDTRGFLGIADTGHKPSNWMMIRTDMPANGPIVAFPKNKQLKIGTYDSYSTNGIWNELILVSENNININASNINIKGQINQNITRKKIIETDNHNVNIDGSNFVKFISASDSFNITGFENGIDGKRITLMNGTEFDLVILSENDNSINENRILGTKDRTVGSKEIIDIIYDGDEGRWILLL